MSTFYSSLESELTFNLLLPQDKNTHIPMPVQTNTLAHFPLAGISSVDPY